MSMEGGGDGGVPGGHHLSVLRDQSMRALFPGAKNNDKIALYARTRVHLALPGFERGKIYLG